MFLTVSKEKYLQYSQKNISAYLESISRKRGGNIMTIRYQQARVEIM